MVSFVSETLRRKNEQTSHNFLHVRVMNLKGMSLLKELSTKSSTSLSASPQSVVISGFARTNLSSVYGGPRSHVIVEAEISVLFLGRKRGKEPRQKTGWFCPDDLLPESSASN